MEEKKLEEKIREILQNTLSIDFVTTYPTKADKKRNPYMKPDGHHEIIGFERAVESILKIINNKKKSKNIIDNSESIEHRSE